MRPTALLIIAAPVLWPVVADAAGDVSAGRDLAITWCSSCHAVEGGGAASDAVRPLAAIARDPAVTEAGLRAFLARPHGEMPRLTLSRREIENLIAYIRSLR